jgi:hypothetical protein
MNTFPAPWRKHRVLFSGTSCLFGRDFSGVTAAGSFKSNENKMLQVRL